MSLILLNPVIFFLTKQIDKANCFIDKLNETLYSYTPKLNEDVTRSRKRNGGKARYSWIFGLYKDGTSISPNLPNPGILLFTGR